MHLNLESTMGDIRRDFVIGIDIGGTKIAAGLIDRQGNILARALSHAHAGCPPDQVVEEATRIALSLFASASVVRDQVAGIGVGCSGHIDCDCGVVMTNSNLPDWNYYPLRAALQARLDLPVLLDNDANCAAWGEFRFGAGRGSRHMTYITFSTGCGMGIIIDRKLYRGATGTAGEIGHTVVNSDGPLCSCGKRGCLMSYACGMALDRVARECLECGEETLLRTLCGDCPEHVQAEKISEAAYQGDPVANRLIAEAGQYFGIGLSTIVQVLNPDTIVIGGGLAHIGPLILDPCIQSLNQNIHPTLVDSARIVLSELWNDAGVIGAGALVWETS
jgi:glucokinase